MRKNGFTIIELLLVIAIIGILASVVLGSLSITRAKARDARRIAEFRQLQTGLELYYTTYGIYPCGDSNENGSSNITGTLDTSLSCIGGGIGFLAGGNPGNCIGTQIGLDDLGIINSCINDPVNKSSAPGMFYMYRVNRVRTGYVLGTYLETNAAMMASDGGTCNDAFEVSGGSISINNNDGSYLRWLGPNQTNCGP